MASPASYALRRHQQQRRRPPQDDDWVRSDGRGFHQCRPACKLCEPPPPPPPPPAITKLDDDDDDAADEDDQKRASSPRPFSPLLFSAADSLAPEFNIG